MATLEHGRWQEVVSNGDRSEGFELIVTRKGVEVRGWYDHIVGLPGFSLPWAELDRARERVAKGEDR